MSPSPKLAVSVLWDFENQKFFFFVILLWGPYVAVYSEASASSVLGGCGMLVTEPSLLPIEFVIQPLCYYPSPDNQNLLLGYLDDYSTAVV